MADVVGRNVGSVFQFSGAKIGFNPQDSRSLISSGIIEPLEAIAFHSDGPFLRRVMASKDLHPSANLHIAVHEINALEPHLDRCYCLPHTHECPELNLLVSFERLVFRVTLGDEVYIQESPASIFIPAGLSHSANVIEGTGFFIAIVGCADYAKSFLGEIAE